MALSLQLGYPDVPKSITNPNVNPNDVLDGGSPFPFLTFFKLIEVSFEPDTLQAYYTYYLRTWNAQNVSKPISDDALIIERYRELIKELSLSYTTLEEKHFLSKIDFNDPYDLDIALSFYAKKLKELTDFYNKKRNDIKFNLIRTKLKGTNFGTEKTITEFTLNYLKSLDDGKILYNYDVIRESLEIEIEELYDTYSFRFNQTPDPKVYDKKDLDYGFDIFLKTNAELFSELFSNVSDELKKWKELDALLDNKRLLTEKQTFTDFYYLSTGNTVTNFISGKLFSSEKQITSFLNRDYPTTASTETSNYLQTPRQEGFFRPLNSAIILVDGITSTYSINFENLAPNSLYYFPDPSIFNDSGNVLTFVVDSSYLKRNITSGNAANQPQSTPQDTKYYGYVSKIEPNVQKNLDIIFDSGYIKDSKRDIYGNTYGLFENLGKHETPLTIIETPTVISMLINGHLFFDNLYGEGLTFDYTVFDYLSTFPETIRTGLSTNTSNFSIITPEIMLFFGRFKPFIELTPPTQKEFIPIYEILDGAYILNTDSTPYIETYSSDLSTFDVLPGQYYYDSVIDCGVAVASPFQRALLDPSYPSLTANLTQYIRTSALTVFNCGEIRGNYDFNIIPRVPTYELLNQTFLATEFYTLSDLPSDFYGKILIKNTTTKTVMPLLDTFPYLSTSYSTEILAELDSIIDKFEIEKDVLFIETPNYLLINKIKYENGQFVHPNAKGLTFQHNTNWCDKFTNRFKVNNFVYYCKLHTTTPQISSNTITVYPTIYRLDTLNYSNTKIYDFEDSIFEITNPSELYDTLDTPTLAYNSRNDIFKISFLLKNINNLPTLFEYDFKLSPDVEFIKRGEYTFNDNTYSTLYETVPTTYNFFLSSGPIFTQLSELIL